MLPSLSEQDIANRSLPYPVFGGDGILGSAVSSDGYDLFISEFAQALVNASRLSVAAFNHHVCIVVGIRADEQVSKLAARGRVACVTDFYAIGDRSVGINIDRPVNEPKSAVPPHAAVAVLDDASLPQSATGCWIADGVEVNFLRERDAAGSVFSGHVPFYHFNGLKETGASEGHH